MDNHNTAFQWDDDIPQKKGIYYGDDEVIKKSRERKAMGSVRPADEEKAASNTVLMQVVFILVAIVGILLVYAFSMNRQVERLRNDQLSRCSEVVESSLKTGFSSVSSAECREKYVNIYVDSSWNNASDSAKRSFLREVQMAITNDYDRFPLLKSKQYIAVYIYRNNAVIASSDDSGTAFVK